MRFKKPLSMWLAVASMLTLLAMSASILMAQSAGTSGLAGTVTDPSGAADSQRHRNYYQQRNRPNAHGQLPAPMAPISSACCRLVPITSVSPPPALKQRIVGAVTLNVTETPELNRTLEIGQQTEQVTVEAAADNSTDAKLHLRKRRQ